MEYLLIIHADPRGFETLPEAVKTEAMGAYRAYTQALQESGALKNSNRLRDARAATTVRVRDGKTEVQNGPFAETREELAGYYLIDVPDLDVALNWAKRCPGASHGSVEVRPVWPMGEY